VVILWSYGWRIYKLCKTFILSQNFEKGCPSNAVVNEERLDSDCKTGLFFSLFGCKLALFEQKVWSESKKDG